MKKTVSLFVVLALLLSACSSMKSPAPNTDQLDSATSPTEEIAEAVQNTDSGNTSSDDLGGALNLVMGGTETPSVFDSYHIEVVMDTPQLNDDSTAVVNEKISISADVAGRNIHIYQLDPGMTEPKEGFIIGDNDTEFKWVDGQWEQTMGQIAMGWAMWPLQVVIPYATISSLYAHKTGNEDINGRSAVVYELDTDKADPAVVAGMADFGVKTTGKGTVWIDKKTGGMLKLLLEYNTDMMNQDGSAAVGTGTGHITLEISKIGQVTVTSPQ